MATSTLNPGTREEILLAKIVGEDVSLSNLTPKTSIGTYEKALEAIADRLNTIGGATADATTTAKGVVKQAANVAKTAVKTYQSNNRLKVDGVAGKQTFSKLCK